MTPDAPRRTRRREIPAQGEKTMRQAILLGAALVLAYPVIAKADDANYAKHEAIANDLVKTINDLADVMESVKDKDTAKAAAIKINKICDRMSDVGKQIEKLPKLSKEEDDKLKAKLEPQLKKASERLIKAAPEAGLKSGGDTDFINSLKRLDEVGKQLSKIGGNK
jgi:hypothetical protein